MVKHGLFGLGLVRAQTGELYLEHGDSARGSNSKKIYAEVEPDDEFYLQLRSDAPETVYADLRVDGTLIKRGHRVHPRVTSTVGVLRADSTAVTGSTNTEVALRFARAHVHADGSREAAATYWTGQVEATFYGNPIYSVPSGTSPAPYSPGGSETRAVAPRPPPVASGSAAVTYAARKTTFFLNPSLASSDVGYVPGKSADNQKKGVKSAEGTTALRQHNLTWNTKPKKPKQPKKPKLEPVVSRIEPLVKEPEVLGSITLRYCSTVGLIHAGILDKPPNWDVERLKNTRSKSDKDRDAKVLSEAKLEKIELKFERINGQGQKVVETREVELFDLTD